MTPVPTLDDAVVEHAVLRLVPLEDDARVGVALDLNIRQPVVVVLAQLLRRGRVPDNLHAVLGLPSNLKNTRSMKFLLDNWLLTTLGSSGSGISLL